MYIKRIVLDGFKSFGKRVEVTGFDPDFNALVGLTASGKSNFIDAICFVLGITNLSSLRVESYEQLIYKNGTGGIKKAIAIITFDNTDKLKSPIGYGKNKEITVSRQVAVGGMDQHMINGIKVTNKIVKDLFLSIQMNVDHRHIVITQGRITQVLNMASDEILEIVEEAVGAKLYEAKKNDSQSIIGVNAGKLKEIDRIIDKQIKPNLQRLRVLVSNHQEHQRVVKEYEKLDRLRIAWTYVRAEANIDESAMRMIEVEEDVENKKKNIKDNERKIKGINKKLTELKKKDRGNEQQVAAELVRGGEEAAATGAGRQWRTRAERRAALAESAQEQQKLKLEMTKRNEKIAQLQQEKAKLIKDNTKLELQQKESIRRANELKTKVAECKEKIKGLQNENPWIEGERQHFGEAGGIYDFAGHEPVGADARLEELRARRVELACELDEDAAASLAVTLAEKELEYANMIRFKENAVAEGNRLIQVMGLTDRLKDRMLTTSCNEVMKHFASICSKLLPGAQVQLQPPPGRGILEGLEIKVGFDDKSTVPLEELPDEQRSLVALAFLLALQMFKTAPLYILEDVDAALDPQHTQNIGTILQDHFRYSQFFIVSQEDSIIEKAAVVFRTSMVDGVSAVHRTVNEVK